MNKRDLIIIVIIGLAVVSGTIIYGLQSGMLTKAITAATMSQASHESTVAKAADSADMSSMPGMGTGNSSDLPSVPQTLPTINIPYDKQQMIGVQTGIASVSPMIKLIRTVGRVAYNEKRLATINTKFDGYIERLYVNATGEYVRRGQPVAEIYSPELLATQMEFINLLRWKNRDKSTASQNDDISGMLAQDASNIVEAARQRLRLFGITDRQINQIETTGQPKRTLTIYSPARGFVVQKQALQGTRVQPGQALFDVADLSTVWILADVYEQDLPLIREGQKATISFPYMPGKTFIASINYVYPALDNTTRTAKVRFTLPNPRGIFKPQMYSDMQISVGLGSQLAVPESALINTGNAQIVYVDMGNGNFQQRRVKTGLRADGMVQILGGLRAGEVVSTSANFLIDSEARLKGGAQ